MIICRCDLADAPVPGNALRPSLDGMKRASEGEDLETRPRGPSEDNDDDDEHDDDDDDDDRVEEEDEKREEEVEEGEGDVFLRPGRNK